MNEKEMMETLKKMLEGINPVTDEKLSPDDVIMQPIIQETLSKAVAKLDWAFNCLYKQWNYQNSGMHWTKVDDYNLRDIYETGLPINVIALIFQRTEGAVRGRLSDLGIKPFTWPHHSYKPAVDSDYLDDDDDEDEDGKIQNYLDEDDL